MDRIKKLKFKLFTLLGLLFFLIVFNMLFSGGFSNFAQALSPNYSKTLPATLDLSEWNNLDDDFVAKSGDTMTGILDMGGNRITNLSNPTLDTDAANKAYVDSQIIAIAGSGAGGTYINWGREDCPTGSDLLYNGVGFGADSDDIGGSDNPICINSNGTVGAAYTDVNGDKMYPMVTGSAGNLPSGITSSRIVKCALCRRAGTCYESYGDWGCNTSAGFSSAYDGYVLGSLTTMSPVGNSGERLCVNSNFDNEYTKSPVDGPVLLGSRIEDNFGLGYTESAFIRCSLCCN